MWMSLDKLFLIEYPRTCPGGGVGCIVEVVAKKRSKGM